MQYLNDTLRSFGDNDQEEVTLGSVTNSEKTLKDNNEVAIAVEQPDLPPDGGLWGWLSVAGSYVVRDSYTCQNHAHDFKGGSFCLVHWGICFYSGACKE